MPEHRIPPPSASLLARFRSHKKRLPLHPLERAVLTVVALHLCFLPWALGTMHPWSQITSLSLSLLTFTLALIPRTYTGDYALPVAGPPAIGSAAAGRQLPVDGRQSPIGSPPFTVHSPPVTGSPHSAHRPPPTVYRLNPWPRLLRFPIFWIGLALLAYIAIQGFNPSWVWERNATHWWLRRVNDIPWLPTSVDTPFERFNLWRQFIIYASAWLTVCTVWVGLTRRRSLELLLIVLIINAVLLTILGFIQRITGTNAILWQWSFKDSSIFSTLIYKNHAGAYFALVASLTVAVAIWMRDAGERAFSKSTPASLLLFVSLLLGAGVLASASRGAVITLVIFSLATSVWYFVRSLRQKGRIGSNPAITILIALFFIGIAVATLRYSDFSAIQQRFAVLSKDPASTIEGRMKAYDAGKDMLADYWQRGTGAGGFRFLYTEYVKKHPDIHAGGRLFWDHLHCDWAETLIELGAVGGLLLALGGAYWLRFFIRHRIIWHSLAVPLLFGCAQTLGHAWLDFPFSCPAILITWLSAVAFAARWVELDAS